MIFKSQTLFFSFFFFGLNKRKTRDGRQLEDNQKKKEKEEREGKPATTTLRVERLLESI
jgi:hypothetical protein